MLNLLTPRRPTRKSKTTRGLRIEPLEGRSLLSLTPFDLFAGNPIVAGNPVQFAGSGKANSDTAIANFKAATGGVNNGGGTANPATGFRAITWDGVAVDGKDSGGPPNTTVISLGNTVGIPNDRFQNLGISFEEVYAVSSDGFATVNPNAAGLFPAFSPKNTFAMFNDNTIGFSFTTPTARGSLPAPAASRGFGAVFLNVTEANTTSIEYFAGSHSLGKFFVPVGGKAEPEFLGELFNAPIVTKVEIVLGDESLFSFDGTNFTAGGADGNGKNLVVTDDFFFAETVPLANAEPVFAGAQGTSAAAATVVTNVGTAFTGTVATFSSANQAATAKDFFAVINWGDGHQTNGSIVANGQGGFDVVGTNTYATAGLFPVAVKAFDFGGSEVTVVNTAKIDKFATQVTLTTSGNAFAGQPITLTATVTTANNGPKPTGTVTFFDGTTAVGTAAVDANGVAKLTTTLAVGNHNLTATFNGDGSTATSTSAAVTQVVSPDVTSLVSIVLGKVKIKGKRVIRTVTIKNLGGSAISGPLHLVLRNLTAGARLVNASGTTQTITPVGSPFVTLNLAKMGGQLGAGSSLSLDLTFTSKKKFVSFASALIAGLNQP